MGSRLKEDEKNERIIRGLLKQPANRRCINCNVLGPQYVCTTFSTFICTNCSGIHREFTHRVKSVSMAKFTPQEIASLQAGGNERAREIYFKELDSQRHPDSSNMHKLRDFIKHVYVDKRFTGERSADRPQREKLGEKEVSENRRSDGYQSGSRSPPSDDTYERRYSARSSPGYDVRRSPGYDQDNHRHSDYGRSPVRSGLVNDWRREDRFANGRRSEDRRSSDGESKSEIRSPDNQKDSHISSPPVVRPVRDILGENVIPLRVGEPPKPNSSKAADGPTPTLTQRTASSSSLASSNGNPAELKRETSLIDFFDAEPEPSITGAGTQAQQPTANQSVTQSTSAPSDENWACFDNVPQTTVSQAPPSSNPLESMLTQLSVPAPAPLSGSASSTPAPSSGLLPSSTSGDLLFDTNASKSAFPNAPATVAPTLPVNGGTAQWSGMQHQHQPFSHANSQPATQQIASSFPNSSSNQGLTGNPGAQASQAAPKPATQTVEVKSSGRNELPADLFTAMYSPAPYQAPGWQAGMVPGMGYHMQYNPAMSVPTFPQPSKSANPFDVGAEASPGQSTTFPSMSPLHAALPNMSAPRGLMHAPHLGNTAPSWMPTQPSSYPSTVPSNPQSFGSSMPGGAYTGQQLPNNLAMGQQFPSNLTMGQQLPNNLAPSRPQGFPSFGNQGAALGSLNPAAASPNPSLGGNPFG